jgi:ABC-2 type transport system ATP-binding protein
MAAEKAIIISTHVLEEVQAVCTRAVIIGQGRVLADGTADQLLTMLPDHTAVCVVVPEAAAAAAAGILRALPNVAAVFETPLAGGHTKLRLTPRNAAPLIGDVGAAVRSHNLPAIEIYQDGGSLDDVFRLITTGILPGAAAAA